MFANSGDAITIVFGSLGGFAALIVAINTVQLRREARQQKLLEADGVNRMDTFEKSQSSLQSALLRADTENERLRARVSGQDTEIGKLRDEVQALRSEVERLSRHAQ